MNKYLTLPTLLTVGLLSFGCEKKSDTVTVALPAATPVDVTVTPKTGTNTLETSKLGRSIDTYVTTPNEVNAADVRKAFADLDGEIAELQSRVATTTGEDRAEAQAKLTNMETYRAKEAVRYNAANLTAPIAGPVSVDARSGAEKVGNSLEKAGEEVKDATEKLGEKIKDATGN